MSNESHPSPTGSSSSSLFGGGGGSNNNTTGGSGSSPYPSPSKLTWAQVLNSNSNTPSNNTSATLTATAGATAATNSSTTGTNIVGNTLGNLPSSSSLLSQHSTTTTSVSGNGQNSGTRSVYTSNVYDPQQKSPMNWPLNLNQSSSQQSLDSNPNIAGGGDGFDRLESSSPTSDWGKPVTTNNSTANGWSNFQPQQQQQTHNNPSRSNAVGNNNNNNNNTASNQWPEMNNFYGTNSSSGVPFNNENSSSSSSTTWQDPSSNSGDTLTLTSSSNSSVINKHKSPSTSSMAASLTGALKSAVALGGLNADLTGGNDESVINDIPQPKLVEQLGWDEPDIKVMKRANFDDGTSIWGDPMESMSVEVKKWTNGTKAALTNSTNTILPQQASIVQKPNSINGQTNNSNTSVSQMVLNNENWPRQQSPTLPQQQQQQQQQQSSSSTSQWNDSTSSNDQASSASQQQGNYRTQQSTSSNWNTQSQQGGARQDEWLTDGLVNTNDWCLQPTKNNVPFDPEEGRINTSRWGESSGPGGAMGRTLPMPSMNQNRFMNDYDLMEGAHDSHNMHRMSNFDNQSLNDPYRQGSDLKNPIIGLGGLLPPSGNTQQSHLMMPPSQLPFASRSGPHYQPGGIIRPMNINGISTSSGAIMGTGGLISPKLSTTSPVPNQAPYVPLAAKQGNIPPSSSQTPTSQQQQAASSNNGAVHAQIMEQFRLAVQAGLISQDLLNTKLPPFMLQLLQKLFELQQKYQALSNQFSDFSKHKQNFPVTFFQAEYERLSKLMTQKRQDMLLVQKQIKEAHAKLIQQQSTSTTPTSSQIMSNGPNNQNPSTPTGSSQSQEQLVDRMQSLNVDKSRLHQWTKPQPSTRTGQSSMFAPPGLSQKDWQTGANNPHDDWENPQINESNTNKSMDPYAHNNQTSAVAADPLSEFEGDNFGGGPPPFVPGQLWNWKTLPSAEDDPHVTPSSLTFGPKGPSSSMSNLNVGATESAFSNSQLLHHMQQQSQMNRSQSQWQHDSQGFQPTMSDWGNPQQYRGTSKPPQSLNHQPASHGAFGGYRPYM